MNETGKEICILVESMGGLKKKKKKISQRDGERDSSYHWRVFLTRSSAPLSIAGSDLASVALSLSLLPFSFLELQTRTSVIFLLFWRPEFTLCLHNNRRFPNTTEAAKHIFKKIDRTCPDYQQVGKERGNYENHFLCHHTFKLSFLGAN